MSFVKEVKALVRLALPVSLAHLAVVGMSATDVLIAGRAGTVDLAGMNLGANIWHMIALFFMGIGFATQPLVAKQFGKQSDFGVKFQLHQSLWMCLGLSLIATVSVFLGAKALLIAPFSDDIKQVAYDYLLIMVMAAIPATLMTALRGTLEAMNLTRAVFFIMAFAFVLNIPLDYVLVNGLYGFPRLGGAGCALASMLLMWLIFICLLLSVKFNHRIRHKNLLKDFSKPDKAAILSTFKLGLPIGFSIVIELSMFAGAGILIASFGAVMASAHAVALTIASLSFMLYMGIGQGVTIRASQFLGAQQPVQAWYSVKVGVWSSLVLASIICLVFLVLKVPLVMLFTNDPAVIKLAVSLMVFAAIFQLADSLQVLMISSLRAYHDTASPPKYQIVAFWIFGLPLGIGLAFYNWLPEFSGAKGLWLAMVVSLLVVGLLLLRRLRKMVRGLEWTKDGMILAN